MHFSFSFKKGDYTFVIFLIIFLLIYVIFGAIIGAINYLLNAEEDVLRTILAFGFVTYVAHSIVILNDRNFEAYVRHNRFWIMAIPSVILTIFCVWAISWQALILIALTQAGSYVLALKLYTTFEYLDNLFL